MRFSLQADPVPQLQVEQTPNAIIVIAIAGSMLSQKLLYGSPSEESPGHAARFQKQAFDVVEFECPPASHSKVLEILTSAGK